MDTLNIDFLNEYKRLEKTCSELLKNQHGISFYLYTMKKLSYKYEIRINKWEYYYSLLRRIRHIRNVLVHDIDTLDKKICSKNDINLIKEFYNLIINRQDPLSLVGKKEINRIRKKENNNIYSNEKRNINEIINQPIKKTIISFALICLIVVLTTLILIN